MIVTVREITRGLTKVKVRFPFALQFIPYCNKPRIEKSESKSPENGESCYSLRPHPVN